MTRRRRPAVSGQPSNGNMAAASVARRPPRRPRAAGRRRWLTVRAARIAATVASDRNSPDRIADSRLGRLLASNLTLQSLKRLMSDFSGKLGLIVGVANKRSISWGIAQALDAGRPARADVSERAARGKRPRTGGEARESARPAVRCLERQQIADTRDDHRSGIRRPRFPRARRGVCAGGGAVESVRRRRHAKDSASRSTSAPIR